MIIIDYNAIALGNILSQGPKFDENLIRHTILNTIRSYNKKYREKYGHMYIACDNYSWRRDVFPEYKHKRRESKEGDDRDWDEVFSVINSIRVDLATNFPYSVIHVKGSEADDIIAHLVRQTQEFGKYENVMIISADKDFVQLQKYGNVKQFSPLTKKLVTTNDPDQYLFEHVIKGDKGDGVPNIKSKDDTFVKGDRQTPITQKFLRACYETTNIKDVLTEEEIVNYTRNKILIDLDNTPKEICDLIDIEIKIQNEKKVNVQNILNYFIKNRMRNLTECIGDFT